jgi:hypothetical protein
MFVPLDKMGKTHTEFLWPLHLTHANFSTKKKTTKLSKLKKKKKKILK